MSGCGCVMRAKDRSKANRRLRLWEAGYTLQQIAEIEGISHNSARAWKNLYVNVGLTRLVNKKRRYKPTPEESAKINLLIKMCRYAKTNTDHSTAQVIGNVLENWHRNGIKALEVIF